MKVVKRRKVKTESKKTIDFICTTCKSELKLKKSDLRRKNMALKDPGIGGCDFKCPVCNEVNYTTKQQEDELGFWAKGFK